MLGIGVDCQVAYPMAWRKAWRIGLSGQRAARLTGVSSLIACGVVISSCSVAPGPPLAEKIQVPEPKPALLARQSPPGCSVTKPPVLAKGSSAESIAPASELQPKVGGPKNPDAWSPFDPKAKDADNAPADDATKQALAIAEAQEGAARTNALAARKIANERDCYAGAEEKTREKLGWLQTAVGKMIATINAHNEKAEGQQNADQAGEIPLRSPEAKRAARAC